MKKIVFTSDEVCLVENMFDEHLLSLEYSISSFRDGELTLAELVDRFEELAFLGNLQIRYHE